MRFLLGVWSAVGVGPGARVSMLSSQPSAHMLANCMGVVGVGLSARTFSSSAILKCMQRLRSCSNDQLV